jgi:acetyltransferase-like isoleucine patch superfamily enzyme
MTAGLVEVLPFCKSFATSFTLADISRPGVTVGRSSTVGAGSVVTRVSHCPIITQFNINISQDVPRFTVVCGNPARVIRGIYRDANDQPQS